MHNINESLGEAGFTNHQSCAAKPVSNGVGMNSLLANLPFDEDEKKSAQVAADLSRVILRAYAGRRVLLVEDDPVNQEISSSLLTNAGLSVEIASDGAQAIAKACNKPFELILMDIYLPKMDGIQACQQIRAIPRLARIPIVAMTARLFPEDREQCFHAGMDDFIPKPVDKAVLYPVLQKWLAHSVEHEPCHPFSRRAK